MLSTWSWAVRRRLLATSWQTHLGQVLSEFFYQMWSIMTTCRHWSHAFVCADGLQASEQVLKQDTGVWLRNGPSPAVTSPFIYIYFTFYLIRTKTKHNPKNSKHWSIFFIKTFCPANSALMTQTQLMWVFSSWGQRKVVWREKGVFWIQK